MIVIQVRVNNQETMLDMEVEAQSQRDDWLVLTETELK